MNNDNVTLTSPNLLEDEDLGWWVYLHTQIILGQTPERKLAAAVGISSRHFIPLEAMGAAWLAADSDEARAYCGQFPRSVGEFRSLLEQQLEATDLPRYYLYRNGEGDAPDQRILTTFNGKVFQMLARATSAANPDSHYSAYEVNWAMPETLDAEAKAATLKRATEAQREQAIKEAMAQQPKKSLILPGRG